MDGLGRPTFMKIGATAFDGNGSAFGRGDNVCAVGVTRRDDTAAIGDEPMHHREQQPSARRDQPGDRRAGERAGIFWMRNCRAERLAVTEECHFLAATREKVCLPRFNRHAETAVVADPLDAGEDRLAHRGGNFSIGALAAVEPLTLIDQDLEKLVLARIEDSAAEEVGFTETLSADRHDALGANDLGCATPPGASRR